MQSIRFCYQEAVNRGTPRPITPDELRAAMTSEAIIRTTAQLQALDPSAEGYEEQKAALKKQLPIIIPHAASFVNGKRKSEDAIPSGFAMLDVDHVDDPKEIWNRIADRADDFGIAMAYITPSFHGLRIIFERDVIPQAEGGFIAESIQSAQQYLAETMGVDYDGVTYDLARASFLMSAQQLLYIDINALTGYRSEEAQAFWKSQQAQSQINKELHKRVRPLCANSEEENSSQEDNSDATTAEVASLAPVGERVSQSDTKGALYKGIRYSLIVERLLLSLGCDGNPSQGERNIVYFSLATNMRYICDFNAAKLLAVLPDFGLSVEERRNTIKSALGRPRKNDLPAILLGALAVAEQQQKMESDYSEEGIKASAASMSMPRMPRLLSLLCRRLPSIYHPAMVMASLPVLGTLATRIRFEYLDGQQHSLSFFTCISAPPASGKSFIRKPINLLLTPINEQDAIEMEKDQKYKEELRKSKNAKVQPQNPHACPRNNGVNISNTRLMELLSYANERHLIGIAEEMDTLVKNERQGTWSQKSDVYRLAFDNAEWTQQNKSEQSFSGKVNVYYNLLITGTPLSINRFFKNDSVEDGLMSRACFVQLPDTSYSVIPHFDDYTPAETEEIINWARRLEHEEGTIDSPVVASAIYEWLENKRIAASDADSHAADILRRRSAVIGFRAGMLAFVLEGRLNKKYIGEFAAWVAEFTFRNQMQLFGDKLEQALSSATTDSGKGEVESLLSALPREFELSDLIALRHKRGQSTAPSTIASVLNRWKRNGKIEKIAPRKYKVL